MICGAEQWMWCDTVMHTPATTARALGRVWLRISGLVSPPPEPL